MRKRKTYGYFSRMTSQELVNYVELNHKGKSITGFENADPRAYQVVSNKKLIDILVTKSILKRIKRNRLSTKIIDLAFDLLEHRLKRVPKQIEFANEYPSELGSIFGGKYNPSIHSWNEYLIFRNKKIRMNKSQLTHQQVDQLFDRQSIELGRTPTYIEFSNKNRKALRVISTGKYNTNIHTWNGYLVHRGKNINRELYKWNTVTVDRAYDTVEKELGRVPKKKEFIKRFPGAADAITKGRYSPDFRSYRDYLEFRGKVNKKFDSINVLETILEGGNKNA